MPREVQWHGPCPGFSSGPAQGPHVHIVAAKDPELPAQLVETQWARFDPEEAEMSIPEKGVKEVACECTGGG